ncbi:hypothetical protein BH11ACT3_BH11ACT3_13510 [soil metagenome]
MTTPVPAQPVQPVLPPLEVGLAYGLTAITLVGVAGIQHFYMGKIGRGIIWLLTWGLFGVGTIIDLVTLPDQVRVVNARRAAGVR